MSVWLDWRETWCWGQLQVSGTVRQGHPARRAHGNEGEEQDPRAMQCAAMGSRCWAGQVCFGRAEWQMSSGRGRADVNVEQRWEWGRIGLWVGWPGRGRY